MKQWMTMLLIFAAALLNSASAQGVQFFEGNWAALLSKAKKEGKLIFVDVYTDWCPPCKQMDKQVFPLKTVGDKYNTLFINYRLDAEKGEGVALAKKYAVKAYPTYLFVDGDGMPVHRMVGFQPAATLIAQADKAMAGGPAEQSISYLEDKFKRGDRDTAFLRNYLFRIKSLGLDNTPVLNAYVATVPEAVLKTPEQLQYLAEQLTSARNNALPFVMAHFNTLAANRQKAIAPLLFSKGLHPSAGLAWKEGRTLELQQILAYMEQLERQLSAAQRPGLDKIRMLYYGMVKDVSAMKKTGYRIVEGLMDIPLDTIRREDARQYAEIMAPYRSGKLDSTKVAGLEEEKQYIINLESRKISLPLYETALAFSETLDKGDPALKDALAWATRARDLLPGNAKLGQLVEKLRELSSTGGEPVR